MNGYRVVAQLARWASWLGAIVLIGLTSASIKEDWNDVVYVINAAFLLFGGIWIGNKLADRVSAFLEKSNSSTD